MLSRCYVLDKAVKTELIKWKAGEALKDPSLDTRISYELQRRQMVQLWKPLQWRASMSKASVKEWKDGRLLAVATVTKGDHKPLYKTSFRYGRKERSIVLYSMKKTNKNGEASEDVLMMWFVPGRQRDQSGSVIIKRSTSAPSGNENPSSSVTECGKFGQLPFISPAVKARVSTRASGEALLWPSSCSYTRSRVSSCQLTPPARLPTHRHTLVRAQVYDACGTLTAKQNLELTCMCVPLGANSYFENRPHSVSDVDAKVMRMLVKKTDTLFLEALIAAGTYRAPTKGKK
jgi:hypothetical protein